MLNYLVEYFFDLWFEANTFWYLFVHKNGSELCCFPDVSFFIFVDVTPLLLLFPWQSVIQRRTSTSHASDLIGMTDVKRLNKVTKQDNTNFLSDKIEAFMFSQHQIPLTGAGKKYKLDMKHCRNVFFVCLDSRQMYMKYLHSTWFRKSSKSDRNIAGYW